MNAKTIQGVSIVIPTYNRARLLGPTLESVKKLKIPASVAIEVLVIDNNCTDNTRQIVEDAARDSQFPIIRILETQQGLCFGRNRGLHEAQYDHLAYLDDDIEVAASWLHGYLEAIEDLNADCVVGPVFPKFQCQPPDFLTERVLDSVTSSYSLKGDGMMLLPPHVGHEVPGCNFGVRKAVALKIGGFNNALGRAGTAMLAGEDTEFGLRLVGSGRRVVYQPKCHIQHAITEEKLSPEHLRKRWAGLGATRRILEKRAQSLPVCRQVRYFIGVIRLLAVSLFYRFRGNLAVAFQRELEARQAWAYLKQSI